MSDVFCKQCGVTDDQQAKTKMLIDDLTKEPTIPSITLGEARPFRLRSRADKRGVVEYVPQHGSLLIMRGRTNAEWEHTVPKTAKDVGERINLAFRFKKGD